MSNNSKVIGEINIDLNKSLESNVKMIEAKMKTAARKISSTAATALTNRAKENLNEFYSYDPKYYVRHPGGMNFHNAIRRYYRNSGYYYEGGVVISPNGFVSQFIGEDGKEHSYNDPIGNATTPDTVFYDVLVDGFHGPSSKYWGIPQPMFPSMDVDLKMLRNQIFYNLNDFVNGGF
jgi:hypothetical protein